MHIDEGHPHPHIARRGELWRGHPPGNDLYKAKVPPVPALFIAHVLGVSGAPIGAVGRRSIGKTSFGSRLPGARSPCRMRVCGFARWPHVLLAGRWSTLSLYSTTHTECGRRRNPHGERVPGSQTTSGGESERFLNIQLILSLYSDGAAGSETAVWVP